MEIKLKTAALQYTRTWPKKHPAFDACSLPCSTQQAGDFGINPTAGYVRLGCLAAIHHTLSHNCCWGVLVVSSSGFSAAAVGNVVNKDMGDGGRREVSVVSSLVYVCVKTTTIEY